MILNRGIKSLAEKYSKDFNYIEYTDQSISNDTLIELSGDCIEIIDDDSTDNFPSSIVLNASLKPTFISSNASATLTNNKITLPSTPIYCNPLIDDESLLKNACELVEKIEVIYENSGYYKQHNHELELDSTNISNNCHFFGCEFNEFQIISNDADSDIESDSINLCLLSKDFLTQKSNVSATIDNAFYFVQNNTQPYINHIFAYGGYYRYDAHPQEIESCIFQISNNTTATKLRISPISAWKEIGVDPTTSAKLQNGHYLYCADNFQDKNKLNLYEEIKSGNSKIKLRNNITNQTNNYTSTSLIHTTGTNLIKINFIKEQHKKDK